MTQDLRVALIISADAKGVQVAAADAARAVGTIAPAAAQAGAQVNAALAPVVPALNAVTPAAAAANTAVRGVGAAAAAAGQQGGAGLAPVAPALAGAGNAAASAARQTQALASATGLTANQMRQLAPQINDLFVQISSGQGLLLPLIQQGGQITQIFGGVRQTAVALVGAIGLTTIGVTAAAAAFGALVISADHNQRALIETQNQLRSTRGDWLSLGETVTDVADRIAETSTTGNTDARSVGAAIAGARGFSGGSVDLERYTRLTADLARVMGTDLPEAASKFVAKAISEPAAAARDAASGGLFGFNDALRRQVELLQAAGDRTGAARLVLEQYDRGVRGAAEDLSFLGRAWQSVAQGITEAWNNLDRFIERQARAVQGAFTPQSAVPGSDVDPRIAELELDLARRQSPGFGVLNAAETQRENAALAAEIARLRAERDARPTALRSIAPELQSLTPGASAREVAAAVDAQGRLAQLPEGFARAVAQQESGFRQTGLNGEILTSSAGALGTMQLMPGTARELGVDPSDQRQNIAGGVEYLRQLLAQFGGDRTLAAAAYNAGPGRVQAVTEGRATLPSETLAYVAAVGGSEGALADRARRAAGGQAALRGQDSRSDERARINAEIGTLTSAQEADPESAGRYAEQIERLRGRLDAIREPAQEVNRGLRDQASLLGVAAGAAEALARAEQDARRTARSSGVDEAAAALEARGAAQAALDAQLGRRIEVLAREADAERTAGRAIGEGAGAMREAEIAARAQTEALGFGAEGTAAYTTAVLRLTAAYRGLEAARGDRATAALLPQQQQEAERLRFEQSLVGVPAAERVAQRAEFQARTDLRRQGRPEDGMNAQTYIANARAIATQNLELQQQQALLDEIGAIGTRAADDINSAMTEMALKGELSFKTLGNVGTAVASQILNAFTRLAFINPLLNALGVGSGTAPTLGSVGTYLFGSSGGTSSTPFGSGGVSADVAGAALLAQGVYHTGGIIGAEMPDSRRVSMHIFAGAPRLHDGGMIAPGEVPAILRNGEGVFTPAQMAAMAPAGGGGGGIVVNFSGDAGSRRDRQKLIEGIARVAARQEIAGSAPALTNLSVNQVVEERRRGGRMAEAFG